MTDKKKTYKSLLWRPDKESPWDDFSDEQLLNYVQRAKETPLISAADTDGKTKMIKSTEAFQDYYKTPFSCSQLCVELSWQG